MFKKRELIDLRAQRLRAVGLLCAAKITKARKLYLEDQIKILNYLIAAMENQLGENHDV
jgi:hypothetical protein